jgi:murein DD-endopeptidase MepM/ murein hydrolase activator NlpD
MINITKFITGRFAMNKGKPKKIEKKYLSIVLVPHSSNQVRVFKFTSFYGRLFAILVLVVGVAVAGSLYFVNAVNENRSLKADLTTLYNANSEQKQLLNDKDKEIDGLKQDEKTFKSSVNEKINSFNDKFNEITDKYISGQNGTKSSRSGDRSEKSFSSDITELKSILDSLNELCDHMDVPSETLTAAEKKLAIYMEAVPTLWPAQGRLSDDFGNRRDPINGRTEYHEGLDIAAAYGSSVKAAAGGKVVLASFYSGFGRAVIIDHGHGLKTLYGHTSKLLVKVGQAVKKGDVIAKVGSSGRSTGPHLHFEVMLYDAPVDPLKYLDSK